MCANARLGSSRTFQVCCVLRKGRNGRRGESARHREVAEDYILFPRFVFSTIVKLTSFFPLSSPFSPIDFFLSPRKEDHANTSTVERIAKAYIYKKRRRKGGESG